MSAASNEIDWGANFTGSIISDAAGEKKKRM
jgi:hypothetical protein